MACQYYARTCTATNSKNAFGTTRYLYEHYCTRYGSKKILMTYGISNKDEGYITPDIAGAPVPASYVYDTCQQYNPNQCSISTGI